MINLKETEMQELRRSFFENQPSLKEFFENTDDTQRKLAYNTGYRTGKGLELEGDTEYNEYISDKFQSQYIDGFMVGMGERNQ